MKFILKHATIYSLQNQYVYTHLHEVNDTTAV